MNTYNAILERIRAGREQTQALSVRDSSGSEAIFPLTDEPNQTEVDATQTAWLRDAIEERRIAQRNGGQS